jgi:hypothetical protein
MLLLNWPDNIQTIVCFARNSRPALAKLILLSDESWPELLGALFQASQSNDPAMREGAFKIFATTPGIIEKQHENTVQEAFSKGFRDENIEVGRYAPLTTLRLTACRSNLPLSKLMHRSSIRLRKKPRPNTSTCCQTFSTFSHLSKILEILSIYRPHLSLSPNLQRLPRECSRLSSVTSSNSALASFKTRSLATRRGSKPLN